MSTELAVRWETTHIAELAYALYNGTTSWFGLQGASTRVPEKVVSKPATPRFFELTIPLFRFFRYPGGRVILTQSDLDRAEALMDAEGILADWKRHLNGKSGVIYATKRSGYLERTVSPQALRCAQILYDQLQIEREEPLKASLTNPYAMAFRVFAGELSEEHIATLERHIAQGTTIKFRGKPHTVSAAQGGFNVLTGRFDTNYDLTPSK